MLHAQRRKLLLIAHEHIPVRHLRLDCAAEPIIEFARRADGLAAVQRHVADGVDGVGRGLNGQRVKGLLRSGERLPVRHLFPRLLRHGVIGRAGGTDGVAALQRDAANRVDCVLGLLHTGFGLGLLLQYRLIFGLSLFEHGQIRQLVPLFIVQRLDGGLRRFDLRAALCGHVADRVDRLLRLPDLAAGAERQKQRRQNGQCHCTFHGPIPPMCDGRDSANFSSIS